MWALRIAILFVGTFSTITAISAKTIYGLYVLCSDLMYVILLPQFTCVLFVTGTNPYGGLVGFFMSLLLRVLSGDKVLKIPAVIKFSGYTEETGKYMINKD